MKPVRTRWIHVYAGGSCVTDECRDRGRTYGYDEKVPSMEHGKPLDSFDGGTWRRGLHVSGVSDLGVEEVVRSEGSVTESGHRVP